MPALFNWAHESHEMKNIFGLGLRPPFYKEAAAGEIAVDWFEVITENFMVDGGNPLKVLDAARSHYPVALHGVSMNLGGTDPLDASYLKGLADLIKRNTPLRVSMSVQRTPRVIDIRQMSDIPVKGSQIIDIKFVQMIVTTGPGHNLHQFY